MRSIEENELKQVEGGGFSWGVAAGIVAAITFVIGIVDGYVNPTACNG